MKVIPPSFEIQDELDRQSPAVRIEACGRLCYKSEDRITAESAAPFVRGIISKKHNSVLEMAAATLRVSYETEMLAGQFFKALPKYLIVDKTAKKEMVITGTIRAFREFYQDQPTLKIAKVMTSTLAADDPLLYEDLIPKNGWVRQEGVNIAKISLAEVDKFSADLLAKHRYVGVKFVVNRAITHEIVRHRPCSYLQESQRYCRYSDNKFDGQVTFIKPLFFEHGSTEYELWQEAMVAAENIYLKLLETSSPQAARTVLPNSCKTELIVYCNLMEWSHIFKLRTSTAAEPTMREVMNPLFEEFRERYPSVFAADL